VRLDGDEPVGVVAGQGSSKLPVHFFAVIGDSAPAGRGRIDRRLIVEYVDDESVDGRRRFGERRPRDEHFVRLDVAKLVACRLVQISQHLRGVEEREAVNGFRVDLVRIDYGDADRAGADAFGRATEVFVRAGVDVSGRARAGRNHGRVPADAADLAALVDADVEGVVLRIDGSGVGIGTVRVGYEALVVGDDRVVVRLAVRDVAIDVAEFEAGVVSKVEPGRVLVHGYPPADSVDEIPFGDGLVEGRDAL